MFAVTVTFTIAPEHLDKFLPLIEENARASVRDEPGCHQFDVCRTSGTPGLIFLYELYSDEAAFKAHQTMPHYAEFNAKAVGLVADKTVTTFENVSR